MIRAGKLRHLITVQRASETIDPAGTPVITWADLVELRAEIMEQDTAESIGAQGATDRRAVAFRVRYVDGITNADRILFNGEPLNIRSVEPDPRFRELILRTETEVSP